jgi:uncharacterized protein YwgA
MGRQLDKEILKKVLVRLNNSNIPLDKVLLHKLMFFLQETGAPVTYRFEPYTYGPFSFEMMEELNDMNYWNEINILGDRIQIGGDLKYDLEKEVEDLVDGLIGQFHELVEQDFSFNNLELYGTALYCYRVLQETEDIVTIDDFEKEFTAWKADKFNQQDIQSTYHKLDHLLQ